MSGRRRDEDGDRAARFVWSDCDVIPLNRDEMVEIPGIDPHTGMQIPGYEFGDEPQPVERWSPEGIAKPAWTDPAEAFLRWFEHESIVYRYAQAQAAQFPDSAIDDIPRLTAAEKKAVLRGNGSRLAGRANPWGPLLRILRSGTASPGLLAVVANLVEAGAFHGPAKKKPVADPSSSPLDPDEVRERVGLFKEILRSEYPDTAGSIRTKAITLHAAEVRLPGETAAQAFKRTEAAYVRGSTAMKRLIALVAAAIVVPEKKSPPA